MILLNNWLSRWIDMIIWYKLTPTDSRVDQPSQIYCWSSFCQSFSSGQVTFTWRDTSHGNFNFVFIRHMWYVYIYGKLQTNLSVMMSTQINSNHMWRCADQDFRSSYPTCFTRRHTQTTTHNTHTQTRMHARAHARTRPPPPPHTHKQWMYFFQNHPTIPCAHGKLIYDFPFTLNDEHQNDKRLSPLTCNMMGTYKYQFLSSWNMQSKH